MPLENKKGRSHCMSILLPKKIPIFRDVNRENFIIWIKCVELKKYLLVSNANLEIIIINAVIAVVLSLGISGGISTLTNA